MGEIIIQYLSTFPKWFQMILLAMLFAGFVYAMITLGHKQIDITMKGIKITEEDGDKIKKPTRRKK